MLVASLDMILSNNKGTDQTVWMRSLVCACVVREPRRQVSHIEAHMINGPPREKTCLGGFGKNTGADQPAHWRSLINAFVIPVLESTISKLASSKISFF